MPTGSVLYPDGTLSLPASTRSGDEFERVGFHVGTSSTRSQFVTLSRFPGAQGKTAH
jgi:hypothetical protein